MKSIQMEIGKYRIVDTLILLIIGIYCFGLYSFWVQNAGFPILRIIISLIALVPLVALPVMFLDLIPDVLPVGSWIDSASIAVPVYFIMYGLAKFGILNIPSPIRLYITLAAPILMLITQRSILKITY